jgi:hypothetical protein
LLTLSNPDAGETLIQLSGPRLHGSNGAYSVIADRALVDLQSIGSLARKAAAWIGSPTLRSTDIYLDELALNLPSATGKPGDAIVLGAVQAKFEHDAAGISRFRALVRRAKAPPDEKPFLRFVVERSAAQPAATISATAETSSAIPAALLAGVPGIDALDGDAMFTGAVHWTLDPNGLTGVAKGRLDGLELSSLLPAGSPHAATGRATGSLTELKWHDRRIERLEGALSIEKSELSASLIAAAVKHLYCVQQSDGAPASESAPMIAVERLACRFVLDGKGLTLTGDMPPERGLPAGCLATSGGASLLVQPPYVDLPAGAWVQFVAGPAASWLPASAGAVKLAERLPLP